MGNILGIGSLLSGKNDAPAPAVATAPLYLSDVKAETATWSQEGLCHTLQRFVGMLPDSEAEVLKQAQRQPQFQRRPSYGIVRLLTFGLNIHLRADAIVVVQRVFRRYRLLTKWHVVTTQVLALARSRLESRAAADEEAMTLTQFRALLTTGFSAHKVSITGSLKHIHLQLVMNARADECYLTWTPSRKRQPRIHLHDIEQVVPVLQTGNKHAPRLATKVSHRRGLIIVCKSHHRGRVVLELASKRERNLLLCGFERLLDELNTAAPVLDAAGALRRRLPRRKSVLGFFDYHADVDASSSANNSNDSDALPLPATTQRNSSSSSSSDVHKPSLTSSSSARQQPPLSATAKSDAAAALEQLYATRFDSDDTDATNSRTQQQKATLVRRSSAVAIAQR